MTNIEVKSVGLTILLLLMPLLGIAQNGEGGATSESVTIRVSAILQGSIEIITIESLDFTNMPQEARELTVSPLTSERAGKMVSRGLSNAAFRVDFQNTRELNNLEGEGIIIFDYSVSGSAEDNQNTAELLEPDMRDLNFNEEGEFYIWVGGTVNLSDALPGIYEGEFIINIEYI